MQREKNIFDKPLVLLIDDVDHFYQEKLSAMALEMDLSLVTLEQVDDFDRFAEHAVLIFVNKTPQKLTKAAHFPTLKMKNDRIVCDILAFADSATTKDRMSWLSDGYDGALNREFVEYDTFKTMFQNRIHKGFIHLENRIQQEEYTQFKAALSASPDAFIVLDNRNKVFFVSQHYKKAYPVNGHKLVRGMDITAAFEMLCAEHNVFPGDTMYDIMYKFWSQPKGEIEFSMGSENIWRLSAAPLPNSRGTIITTTDISAYKKQSMALEAALAKEREATAIQKQFVDMVSHEFRTPLSIIDGHAQIILRRQASLSKNDMTERVSIIRSAVSRLLNMMEGILSSNMLKTGKFEIDCKPFDVCSLIETLVNEHKRLSDNVEITFDIQNIPAFVNIDGKILTLAISNLLSNAVKFSEGDKPIIQLSAKIDDDALYIDVKDNGMGIPENEIEHVFERYFRSTIASGIPGSGLGLNLVKDMVNLHGGDVSVESERGKGAHFRFWIHIA
jgi:signal transduction histidine kinase